MSIYINLKISKKLNVIGFFIACTYLLLSSVSAETIVYTATYNYIFTQLETEDQARVIARTRTRQAIINAAVPTVQKSNVYKNALPVENLPHALASGVMTFETKSLTMEKTTNGHSVSLKDIGSLNMETLEDDLGSLINNLFLFENALANRVREGALLESLGILQEKYQATQEGGGREKNLVSEKERLTEERWRLVNRLWAISLNDAIIADMLKKNVVDPAETIKRLNRAVALDDRNVWLYLQRGRVFSQLRDRISASADFDRAVLLNPYLLFPYEFKGDVLFRAGEMQGAINSYNKAIALDQKYGPALMKRGRAYRNTVQYTWAVKDFTRIIDMDPGNPAG